MVDISSVIDNKIEETFVNKGAKSYPINKFLQKIPSSNIPSQTNRLKNIMTPKNHMKEDKSLLIRSAKTRSGSQEYNRTQTLKTVDSGKNKTDSWKMHKRVALLQHPLWVESIKNWWNVMDPHGINNPDAGTDGKITKEQYLDLNIRLQKALNLDFDYENACISALDDWEIDAEDWDGIISIGETQHLCTPNSMYSKSEEIQYSKIFGFDKFSEFLFETGEIWCNGNIEGILIIINLAMLHISQGVHIKTTTLKDINSISLLSNSLFQEISDLAFNNSLNQEEFIKWYHINFLELEDMKKFVTEKLLNFMPQESRINDLWIIQQGYNQTDILIQCTNRLEDLLNRIQKEPPVSFPIKDGAIKKKIKGNSEIISEVNQQKPLLPNLPSIKSSKNEPVVLENKIVFTRSINLSLVGQSCTSRYKSQELIENIKHTNPSIKYDDSKEIKVTAINEIKSLMPPKFETQYSSPHSERDFTFDTLFQNIEPKRPYSTPLHAIQKRKLIKSNSHLTLFSLEDKRLFEENDDPEYTPKLKFNKDDVKYHKLQKSWRKGKFMKFHLEKETPEVGEINKKNSVEYNDNKKKHCKEMINDYENIRRTKTQGHSRNKTYCQTDLKINEKDESGESEDIERLVGIKLSVNETTRENKSIGITKRIKERSAQTAQETSRQKVSLNKTKAIYTFEEFSHLIKYNNSQKLAFEDNLEYLCALNQAKHEFNTNYQSNFLTTYNKRKNEYRSRRDELKGHISTENWKKFIQNLEEIIKITNKKKRNKRLRRKKQGKSNNIYKGLNVGTSRLWKSIFIKPFNKEKMQREKYLREASKIDNIKMDGLLKPLDTIINENPKIPIPLYPKKKSKTTRYSPGRYRLVS